MSPVQNEWGIEHEHQDSHHDVEVLHRLVFFHKQYPSKQCDHAWQCSQYLYSVVLLIFVWSKSYLDPQNDQYDDGANHDSVLDWEVSQEHDASQHQELPQRVHKLPVKCILIQTLIQKQQICFDNIILQFCSVFYEYYECNGWHANDPENKHREPNDKGPQ